MGLIDGNKLGDVGFKYLGVSYSQMDCQAFVEQCLRDCGTNKDLAGSNAWYREVAKNGAVMTPEECVKQLGCVPKGAFLFILLQDGKEPAKYKPDGMGNASHIGICTGTRGKGAIHSSASRGCVAESDFKGKTIKNGGWNRVGLWDKIVFDYVGGSDTPNEFPTLRRGDRGEYVTLAQTKLIQKGYSCGSSGADGVFGKDTEAAVRAMQWDFSLDVDGVIGRQSWGILNQTTETELFSVTIDGLTESQADALIRQYPNAIKGRG